MTTEEYLAYYIRRALDAIRSGWPITADNSAHAAAHFAFLIHPELRD